MTLNEEIEKLKISRSNLGRELGGISPKLALHKQIEKQISDITVKIDALDAKRRATIVSKADEKTETKRTSLKLQTV